MSASVGLLMLALEACRDRLAAEEGPSVLLRSPCVVGSYEMANGDARSVAAALANTLLERLDKSPCRGLTNCGISQRSTMTLWRCFAWRRAQRAASTSPHCSTLVTIVGPRLRHARYAA